MIINITLFRGGLDLLASVWAVRITLLRVRRSKATVSIERPDRIFGCLACIVEERLELRA